MKKRHRNILRVLSASLCLLVLLSACGGNPSGNGANTGTDEPANSNSNGTIMWMAHMNSGSGYSSFRNYMEGLCNEMGYNFTVVYGDSANSASGNLDAVRNGMTDDVVGLVASMDGGLNAIMEEYPDLYVLGMASDMRSVYGENGDSKACLSKDHFLGAIAEGYCNGADIGAMYAQQVIDGGYKKIRIIKFPDYAYPTGAEADAALREAIGAYNATAAEPIEIVGDTVTLQFSVLPDSFFLEQENADLDCIVSLCSGTSFVYPTVVAAKANGTCAPNLKILTVGFNDDPNIAADTGDDGTLASIYAVHIETLSAYAMILLDNAIRGEQFADFEPKAVDSCLYLIDTQAKVEAQIDAINLVLNKDLANCSIPLEVALSLSTRANPNATHAGLIEAIQALNTQ